MNTNQQKILRSLCSFGRNKIYFTGILGEEVNVQLELDSLLESGHIYANTRSFQITEKGRCALYGQGDVTAPRRITNASVVDKYIPVKWQSARPGADAFLSVDSLGLSV